MDPDALVRAWFHEVWDEGREDAIDRLMAADAIVHGLGEQEIRGPAAFKPFFHVMRTALGDLEVRVERGALVRTALSVTSLWMKSTCPGPPGEYRIRQWLTRVSCGPFWSRCNRMKEFSPVRRTLLGSVSAMFGLLTRTSASSLKDYHTSFVPHSCCENTSIKRSASGCGGPCQLIARAHGHETRADRTASGRAPYAAVGRFVRSRQMSNLCCISCRQAKADKRCGRGRKCWAMGP